MLHRLCQFNNFAVSDMIRVCMSMRVFGYVYELFECDMIGYTHNIRV